MKVDRPPSITSPVRAIILTADKFEDMELFFPYFRLLEEGLHVKVAAPEIERLTGENGYWFENVDLRIDDVDPNDFDLLLIPGGHPHGAPTTVRNHKHAQEITRAFMKQDKMVSAICHGPYTLVSSDVVRARRLTGFWGDGVPQEIAAAGGLYQETPVVVDRNLVTARWPPDLPGFMRETIRLVREFEVR